MSGIRPPGRRSAVRHAGIAVVITALVLAAAGASGRSARTDAQASPKVTAATGAPADPSQSSLPGLEPSAVSSPPATGAGGNVPEAAAGRQPSNGARRAPTATATATPTPTPTLLPSPPVWLPFRTQMKVGCVISNCDGPYHGYWAVDFETMDNQPGAPVYAAGAGRAHIVSRGSTCGGPGTAANAVQVDHGGGRVSIYFHLSDIVVGEGAWVTPATLVGHVGSTGYTIPCPDFHLHFEVRVNGVSVNPGPLYACHGASRLTYPSAAGYTSWNDIPAQVHASDPLGPNTVLISSTGANC